MFCKQCGQQLALNAIICQKCGAATGSNMSANNMGINRGGARADDRGGCLWLFLGYMLGWISLILYFVWRHEYPLRAKAILMGFIIEVVALLAMIVIAGVVVAILIATGHINFSVMQPILSLLPMLA